MMKRAKSFSVLACVYAIGALSSIVLHELFHLAMHFGQIKRFELFSGGTIARMNVMVPRGYNTALEELVAYSITIVVLIATVVLAIKLSRRV